MAPPLSGLGQGCCWKITLGRALQWDALASSPISQTLTTNYYTHTHTHTYAFTSPPPIPRLRRFEPPAWQAGLCQRRNSGCGTGWLLAGAGFLPLWQSHVFTVYVLLCWGVFPVLTLYSPRSIVWGLFFSPHLPHVMLYFFFPFLLAFHYWLYSVWLCMWQIIKNLEPTLNQHD